MYSGRDRIGTTPSCVPSRREILSRPDLSSPEIFQGGNFPSQNASGRDKLEHPYVYHIKDYVNIFSNLSLSTSSTQLLGVN